VTTKYLNSTSSPEFLVYRLKNSPEIRSVCYILDKQPPKYLNNSKGVYGLDPYVGKFYGYYATYKVELENLSEGNHTIKVCANDLNQYPMVASRNFTVNDHYQIAVIEVLSPNNQTHYRGKIPLNFIVNAEIKHAHYYYFKPFGFGSIAANTITSNTTIESPPEGTYQLLIFAQTEKGNATALANFTISNNAVDLENQPIVLIISTIGITLVTALTVIQYKRKKLKEATTNKIFLRPQYCKPPSPKGTILAP
jgi:hypothetical protein